MLPTTTLLHSPNPPHLTCSLYFVQLGMWQTFVCPHSNTALVVTREYTVNIHKRIHGVGFKNMAPCAIIRLCVSLQWRWWEPLMCVLTPVSTNTCGPRVSRKCYTVCVCDWPVRETRMRTLPTNYTPSSHTSPSPHSNALRPSMWRAPIELCKWMKLKAKK